MLDIQNIQNIFYRYSIDILYLCKIYRISIEYIEYVKIYDVYK